eukprot:TRINITY_DN2923_c0_g1_i1.p1 TRINITY_DN2923_c0_g1~~TRINITY_DN2923_c0_g1_i1.p1  ORF type:complete len:203 (-),score=42.85 TRINITY_DN2923_c0_g1_i1:145-699(-)
MSVRTYMASLGPQKSPSMLMKSTAFNFTSASLDAMERVGAIHNKKVAECVLSFLNVTCLGRMQQLSRMWYKIGRANALWKCALNQQSLQTRWPQCNREKLKRQMRRLDKDEIKWKHICFFWMATRQCRVCGVLYKQYQVVPTYRCKGGGKHVSTLPDVVIIGEHNPESDTGSADYDTSSDSGSG